MKRYRMLVPLLLLTGCADPEPGGGAGEQPPWVLTAPVRAAAARDAQMSGTVRARFETPLAFQIGGRILSREVDAGQQVTAGQVLFRLDPRDLDQQLNVARASLEEARAELATAEAETRRNRDLVDRKFISAQSLERVELAERSARERVDGARARLQQARNALGYAELTAKHAGVLIAVSGEPGQVVGAGEAIAVLAEEQVREVELSLPERVGVPLSGRVLGDSNTLATLALREVAGAADPATRTWSARYTVVESAEPLRLGSVVRVALDLDQAAARVLEVPIGAINERGHGPQVWIIEDGQAQAVPVSLLDIDREQARIVADLPDDARVIALGTHLLSPGMPVREQR